MEIEPLVQRLVEIQAQKGLSGAKFAVLLGIHAGHWSKVRRGLERPGRDTIDGALRQWPELSFVYADSLRKRTDTHAETQKESVA